MDDRDVQAISYLLAELERWVDSLPDDELGENYDRQARDFFQFLRDYDANIGRVVNLIKRYADIHPSQIRTRQDAQQLRDMLSRYGTSEILGRRVPPSQLPNPGNWAYDNTAFSFDERDEPPC